MTQTVQSGTSGTREDSIELLGLVAQLQLEAFTRSAEDSAVAPTLGQRLALSRFAADAVGRRDRVMDRIVEVGGDPLAAMAHFDHVLDDFDLRTSPSTWWERLLTSYVGYGVADDFCRIAAARLDESSRALVLDVLDDHSHADGAVARRSASSRHCSAHVRRCCGSPRGPMSTSRQGRRRASCSASSPPSTRTAWAGWA